HDGEPAPRVLGVLRLPSTPARLIGRAKRRAYRHGHVRFEPAARVLTEGLEIAHPATVVRRLARCKAIRAGKHRAPGEPRAWSVASQMGHRLRDEPDVRSQTDTTTLEFVT